MSNTPAKDTGLLDEAVAYLSAPVTDWADTGHDSTGSGQGRSELQAMIARKRRNDAVRMAELNLLRRIRRQGLTGDEIRDKERKQGFDLVTRLAQEQQAESPSRLRPSASACGPAGAAGTTADPAAVRSAAAPAHRAGRHRLVASGASGRVDVAPTVRPEEAAHDTELEPAAIAFANADFAGCDRVLRALVGARGPRRHHTPTWRVLLDLYRATGQQQAFDQAARPYVQDLGQQPPHWVSIPRLVMSPADVSAQRQQAAAIGSRQAPSPAAAVSWLCPTLLDGAAVQSMQAFMQGCQGRSVPMIDWTTARVVTVDGAVALQAFIQACADSPIRLLWRGVAVLLDLLHQAPRGAGRPADLAFWQARLGMLRLMGVQGPYDLAAADFKTAYGKATAPWSPATAKIVMAEHSTPPDAHPGRAAAGHQGLAHESAGPASQPAVELVGHLTGDIGDTLTQALAKLRGAHIVEIDCARLIRMDMMAASEFLDWVRARRREGRVVRLVGVHRLVGIFLITMGLDDQANIEWRPL